MWLTCRGMTWARTSSWMQTLDIEKPSAAALIMKSSNLRSSHSGEAACNLGKFVPNQLFPSHGQKYAQRFSAKEFWPNAANGTKNCVCGGELRVKNANKRTNKNTLVVEKSSYTVFHYLVKHKRTHWGVRIFFLFFFFAFTAVSWYKEYVAWMNP